MGNKYEESHECLSVLAERSCYVFILYMKYNSSVYVLYCNIVYELH